MQQLISWGELWTWMVLTAFIWYTAVALLYYRRDIGVALRAKNAQHSPVVNGGFSGKDLPENEGAQQVRDPHTTVHELLQELKTVFATFGKNPPSRRDALDAIALRLKPCTWLEPSLRQAINQYIVNEFSLHGGEPVSQQDIESLW